MDVVQSSLQMKGIWNACSVEMPSVRHVILLCMKDFSIVLGVFTILAVFVYKKAPKFSKAYFINSF